MPHYLAIDAGGTKTTCLLAESNTHATHILARASTASIKLMRVSEPEATARLTALLREVSAAANVPLDHITRTCIGLAGLSIPAVRAWATRTLAATVSGEILLLGDEEIALDAAFPAAAGILLIAGTGSNAIGRSPSGALHRAGGWGPILGDLGSGYWIGLRAIRAALQSFDSEPTSPPSTAPGLTHNACHSDPKGNEGEEPPYFSRSATEPTATPQDTPARTLLYEIQTHFNLASLPELIALGNHRGDAAHPAPDFASLAPTIARAAAAGNPIALATLHRAGQHLASLIAQVAHKLAAEDPPTAHLPHPAPEILGAPLTTASSSWVGSQIPIAFTGSVLTHIPAVREALIAHLSTILPEAHLHPAPIDPLLGALHRALHG